MIITEKRIGIVGGGQLGRMLAQAARGMGFTTIVLDPTPRGPAAQVADRELVGDFKNADAVRELAKEVDLLTFEIESANAEALHELAKQGMPVHPSAQTLAIIKDKLAQKTFLRKAGIPVADFMGVESVEDIHAAGKKFGYPFLLKARFDAYDGRGNALIKSISDIEEGMKKLEGRKLYVEKFVPFSKELAVVAVRGMSGEVATYPVVETIHRNNICHIVIAPAQIPQEAQVRAGKLAAQVLEKLGGVGVFGIEMFLAKNGDVLVNEIAPRVHNSGHHTIEACDVSQFENHIRAVTGLDIGSTRMKVPAAVMVNILGERSGKAEVTGLEEALKIPGVAVHVYGKLETRPERKMGHITATGKTVEEALEKATRARKHITI